MPRPYWVFTTLWAVAAVASGPVLIELLDGAGIAARLPGLSVTGTELVLIGALAAAGPLVGAAVVRRRARKRAA